MDQWQGRLSFCKVIAHIFSDFPALRIIIKNVVRHLKCGTQIHAIVRQRLAGFVILVCDADAEQGGGFK